MKFQSKVTATGALVTLATACMGTVLAAKSIEIGKIDGTPIRVSDDMLFGPVQYSGEDIWRPKSVDKGIYPSKEIDNFGLLLRICHHTLCASPRGSNIESSHVFMVNVNVRDRASWGADFVSEKRNNLLTFGASGTAWIRLSDGGAEKWRLRGSIKPFTIPADYIYIDNIRRFIVSCQYYAKPAAKGLSSVPCDGYFVDKGLNAIVWIRMQFGDIGKSEHLRSAVLAVDQSFLGR